MTRSLIRPLLKGRLLELASVALLTLSCGGNDGPTGTPGSGSTATGGSVANFDPLGGASALGGGQGLGGGGAGGMSCTGASQKMCGSACVDTASDANHCGDCGRACTNGMSCMAGTCACPSGQDICDGKCVDFKTDAQNCGRCGGACETGLLCRDATCGCADDQMLCGTSCAVTQEDPLNCGMCGNKCGIGKTCTGGSCVPSKGGDPGPDGCVGLAANITLSSIATYQTVEIPVMKDGTEVAPAARKTDLVAGRDTLFRLFVTTGSGWQPRSISGRVFIDNEGTVDVYSTKKSPSASSSASNLDSTFQVLVPKEKITPSTIYQVELVECGAAAATPGDVRFPADAAVALGARTTGPVKVKVIPLVAGNMEPDTSENGLKIYKDTLLALYPTPSVELTVGEKLTVSDAKDWTAMLDAVRNRRRTDSPANDVYYYGLLKPTATLREYCGNGCTAGIGYVVNQGTASQQRASLGLGFGDAASAGTMAHELGHNHGRSHAPCVPRGGSISGVDPGYPYDGGAVGVAGWDMRSMSLVPATNTDMMGYCDKTWISDYTYDALLTRIANVNGAGMKELPPPVPAQPWRVLLLDDRGLRWGIPITQPALPSGLPELAEVLDAQGNVIDVVEVYRTAISDIDAFSFEVPEPQPGWAAIHVIGAGALLFP